MAIMAPVVDRGQIARAVLLLDPDLDLAAVGPLGREIPPLMENAQNLDVLAPVGGLRVQSVEQCVGMGGGGAKVAG